MPLTINVRQLARVLGVSDWAVYQSIKEDNCPVQPIRVGRRIVFSRAAVEQLLGADEVHELELEVDP